MSRAAALAALLTLAACQPDRGSVDAGPEDSGLDASVSDAGDGGPTDAGPSDAGDDPDPVFTLTERAALDAMAPAVWPGPVADLSNQYANDAAAAALGQKLFFDPLFSGVLLDGDNDGSAHTLGRAGEAGKVSCAGCHVADAGFLDDRTLGKQISLAAGWVIRRTPSLLDVGQARLLMWDGSKDTLFSQVFGPIESRDEMNSSRLFVAQQIAARYASEYQAVFGALPVMTDAARFPPMTPQTTGCRRTGVNQFSCHGMPGDGAEYDGMAPADQAAVTRVVVNVGKAIGAYERKLSCGPGRFDRWAHGEATALTRAEQRGAALFVGKATCVPCHGGPFMSDQKFHVVGLKARTVAVTFLDLGDKGASEGLPKANASPLNVRSAYSDGDDGRLPTTVAPEMLGAFRTPTLRCASRRPSFMHTGHVRTLAEVVEFFDQGGDVGGFEGTREIAPLQLAERERTDLVAFLMALDGPGPASSLLGPP